MVRKERIFQGEEGIDYIVCGWCGMRARLLNSAHWRVCTGAEGRGRREYVFEFGPKAIRAESYARNRSKTATTHLVLTGICKETLSPGNTGKVHTLESREISRRYRQREAQERVEQAKQLAAKQGCVLLQELAEKFDLNRDTLKVACIQERLDHIVIKVGKYIFYASKSAWLVEAIEHKRIRVT